MEKIIIAAVAENGAIGRAGTLPWHLPQDLKHFREVTMGHAVVMGRRTFLSIGKPLEGRLNIVLSRSGFEAPGGVMVVPDLQAAFALAEKEGCTKCYIAGGEQVYREALPLADRMDITLVHTTVEDADRYFPEWGRKTKD